MDDVNKVTIISNRASEQLCERVKEDFALKLEDSDREKFERKNAYVKNFPSGEVYVQLQENIRRRRVHVIVGSYRPELYHLRKQVLKLDSDSGISEKLMQDYLHSAETDFIEALKILDAAKRSGAEEISVYFPYLADSRQDKKDESRVPISAKLKLELVETAAWPKLSRIGVLDLHARQEQAFTEYPVDTMTAKSYLILALKHQGVSFDELVLVCADTNDYKHMRIFADHFGVGVGAILKARKGHNVVDKLHCMLEMISKEKSVQLWMICLTLQAPFSTELRLQHNKNQKKFMHAQLTEFSALQLTKKQKKSILLKIGLSRHMKNMVCKL